jgi:hypothetical protein
MVPVVHSRRRGFARIITGFDVAVTVFASGLATILAAVGSRNRIPLYYGGSFAYLAAVVGIVTAEFGSTELAQVGVVATGILNIVIGYIIKAAGKERLDLVLRLGAARHRIGGRRWDSPEPSVPATRRILRGAASRSP